MSLVLNLHVRDELEAVKRRQDNLSTDETRANVGLNYEKALIKSLENRIASLERSLQQKQEIIDRQLFEKQNIIEKLLINNNIQAQAQLKPLLNNEEQSIQKKQSDAQTTSKDKKEPERKEENNEKAKAKKPTNKEGTQTKPTNKEGAQTIANDTRQDPKEKPNRKTIFLTGDSLLNGISENGLQNKHNVKSRPHSGASSEDMVDFIKPYLRKKPDAIILHCGTNDLTKGVDTIKGLEEIVQTAKTQSEGTELIISGLMTRRDKPGMIREVADLNSRIKDFCRNQQIKFIDNSNLDAA